MDASMNLDRLPAELMSLIVQQLASDDARHYDDGENDLDRERDKKWIIRERVPELKRLRLVCRRWAYLPSLLKVVFENVSFKVSRKHMEDLERYIINGSMAPYVSRVTFVPPSESWTLSHSEFEKIVEQTTICLRNHHGRDAWSNLNDKYIEQYGLNGPSEGQLRQGYLDYQRRSHVSCALLQSQELQQTWVRALRKLSKCHTVYFRASRRDIESEIHKSIGFDHTFPLNWSINPSTRATYIAGAMSIDDLVVRTAIECLAEARMPIHELDVMLFMGLSGSWNSIPQWTDLDCSELRKLIFAPMGPLLFGPYEQMQWDVVRGAMLAILKKCCMSLEHFEIQPIKEGNHRLASWIGPDIVSLKKLKYFRIKDACADADSVSGWIEQMPSLGHVRLQLMALEDHTAGSWRLVYDAFRAHPNNLRIQLGTNSINGDYGLILDFRKSEYEQHLVDPISPMLRIKRSLALYISGRIEWDDVLEGNHQ